MPWNDQGGGPWKPNNQSPWGQGPWGQGPGGSTPPNLEELLRRSQDRLRNILPSSFGGRGVLWLALIALLAWACSGFYTVGPNEVGLNLIFGRYTGKTSAGLNYNLPYPIGTVQKLKVTDRNSTDIGSKYVLSGRGNPTQIDVPDESLMLTGDENIADVKFRVIWQIDPVHPEDYAFNVRNQEETVKAVAESAMREIVGRSQIQKILTAERKVIEPATQELMQRVLNEYKAGVLVLQVQLLSVDPPASVISAFRDVTAAQQDLQRQRNEAEAYANRVVPEARGAAARIIQEAEGYREQSVAGARGQTSRFLQIYEQYKRAPDVTRERLYLETMERVLGAGDKVIIKQSNGPGVVPYLPLDELNKSAAPTQGARR